MVSSMVVNFVRRWVTPDATALKRAGVCKLPAFRYLICWLGLTWTPKDRLEFDSQRRFMSRNGKASSVVVVTLPHLGAVAALAFQTSAVNWRKSPSAWWLMAF